MIVVAILISLIDLILVFLFSNKLVEKPAYLDLKRIVIGILYAVTFGALVNYTLRNDSLYRMLALVVDLILIHKITERSFIGTLLAYALFLMTLNIMQLPIVILLELFISEQQIMFLIGQFTTLFIFVIICAKVPINKAYRFLEKHYWLQLIIAIVAFASTGLAFYWSLEYSLLIFMIGLLVIFSIAMYKIGQKVTYLTYTVPSKMHDLRNRLHGKLIKAYQEKDHARIAFCQEMLEENGIPTEINNLLLGKTTENIVAFIEGKKEEHAFDGEVIPEINYYKDHLRIGLDIIIKCMGILLDNAFESGTKKPIIVELDVGMGHIHLYVRNEFELTDPEAIEQIFIEDGYTTKKHRNRGYGISNLHHEVTKHNGKIVDSYRYNEIGKTNYLTIGVRF